MNQQEIKNIHTENVAVVFNAVGEKSFNLNCPFIPDRIEVSGGIFNADGGLFIYTITPMLSTVVRNGGNFDLDTNFGSNIYEIRSNLPLGNGSSSLCVFNAGNTYNPMSIYQNTGRSSFQGSYVLNCFNLTNNQLLSLGGVCLTFRFIRYEDK